MVQSINVRGAETSFNGSWFENNPMERMIWKHQEHPGCVISKALVAGVCGDNGVAHVDGGPIQFTPSAAHDYTELSFNQKYIATAVCRTNKQGTRVGLAARKSIFCQYLLL